MKVFYYNRNVDNRSWYGKPNFLPASQLIWFVDSQISGKGFLIVLKNIHGRKRKFLFLYPHSEKTSRPMWSKVNVVKFLQYIMTWCMNLLTLSYPLQYAEDESLIGQCETVGWVTNWAMWTQYNPRIPLSVIAMISKGCFWQIFNIIIKFAFRAFLYLNPSTVHVVLNSYLAHFDRS